MAIKKTHDDSNMGETIHPVTSHAQGETFKGVDDTTLDEAARYIAAHDKFGPMTPEKEKEIVRKIDRHVVPMVSHAWFFASSFSQILG